MIEDGDNSKEETLLHDGRINPISNRPTNVNKKEEINEKNKSEERIGLTPYRYIIVIIYFFLNFINGMHWVTFASIATKFGKFYHLNHFLVDLFSLLFMILYPIGCIPEAYIIDNISMQNGLRISAILLIIGSLLKIMINTSIIFAYIGQFFTAVFQPAILNSPGKIASTWFNEKRRTLVTSICCVSNTIGIIFGYLIHSFVIEDNTVNPKIFKEAFKSYLLIEFIITTIFCLLFIFLIKNKPKIPPSISQKNYRPISLKDGIKKLMTNINFIKILISLTCIVGFINIYGTIFNSYMALYKIKDSSATFTLAIANIFGIITALIVGAIIDKSKKYKLAMIICNIISLLVLIITTILLETIEKKSLGLTSFICYTLVIGATIPIYTSGMDFICEITYPVGESISEGIIMSFNQIMGIIGIIICDIFRTYLQNIKFMTNVFCILLFTISLISIFLVNSKLVRTEKDKQNINNDDEQKGILEN